MSSRGIALIAVALCLSAGLLGVQLASGGADFVPERPADPCQDRAPTGQRTTSRASRRRSSSPASTTPPASWA